MKKLIILIALVMVLLASTGCEITDRTEVDSTITFTDFEKITEIRTR